MGVLQVVIMLSTELAEEYSFILKNAEIKK